MGELLSPLPVVIPGSVVSTGASGSCNEQLGGYGVACRVGSFLEGKRDRYALVERRKSCLSSPTFWGTQLASQSLLDRQTTLTRRHTKLHSRLSLSPGSIVAFSDPELQSVLELASDAELLDLSNILYGRSFLSPLLKSLTNGDGSKGKHHGHSPNNQADRDALMTRLEERFLFLAADAKAILRGHRPSYRNVLLRVREKLQVPCSADLSTADMESEIFLYLLQQYTRKPVATPAASQKALMAPSVDRKKSLKARKWHAGLPTMMKLRGRELLSTVLKGGGAVTVSTLQQMVFKKLSGKLLLETARYQLAKEAVVKTGQVAAMLETRVAVLAARQGLVGAAKHYLTLRSAMMVLGPMLWGTLLADMLISAVGTDYARVVRAIYAFAQIRLVRSYSWDDTHQVF